MASALRDRCGAAAALGAVRVPEDGGKVEAALEGWLQRGLSSRAGLAID
jgi:hypothetical protein